MLNSGLEIALPVHELRSAFIECQSQLTRQSDEILEVVGEVLLAHVNQAYREKARGETGSDGLKWQPIQLGTLLARLRRMKHIGRLKAQDARHTRTKTAANYGHFFRLNKSTEETRLHIASIERAELGRVLSGGTGKQRYKAGAVVGITKGKKSGTVRETLKQRIAPGAGGYEIGINTGKQLATLSPGGKGSAAGNLVVQNLSVTASASMSYSPYFDRQRPIIPDLLPQQWIKEMEELVVERGIKILEIEFAKII